MIKSILLPYLSLMSRFHGGGFVQGKPAIKTAEIVQKILPKIIAPTISSDGLVSWPRIVRAAIFALPYGLVMHHHPYIAVASFLFAYVGKNIGHEDFWMMGTGPSLGKDNFLTKLVQLTGLKRDSLGWCWLGMSVKGFVTALGTANPLIILGHTAALPLSYYIGRHTRYGSELAEYLSGLLYGLVLALLL